MVSVGGKTAAPHYNKHPKILHSKTNVELAFIMFHSSCIIEYAQQQMHTSILKLIYINSDLLHVSANHVLIFGWIKHKRMNTIKSIKWNYRSYQNEFTSQPRLRVILKSHFAGCLSWFQLNVVYRVISIHILLVHIYFDCRFTFQFYLLVIIWCPLNVIEYLTITYFHYYRNMN